MKKQGSRSTSYKHPDIKEGADYIMGEDYFLRLAEPIPFKTRCT